MTQDEIIKDIKNCWKHILDVEEKIKQKKENFSWPLLILTLFSTWYISVLVLNITNNNWYLLLLLLVIPELLIAFLPIISLKLLRKVLLESKNLMYKSLGACVYLEIRKGEN